MHQMFRLKLCIFIAIQMEASVLQPTHQTLSPTQRRYIQMKHKALAVIFGLQKFHYFLYGRKYILVTYYTPLVYMFNPAKETPTSLHQTIFRNGAGNEVLHTSVQLLTIQLKKELLNVWYNHLSSQ